MIVSPGDPPAPGQGPRRYLVGGPARRRRRPVMTLQLRRTGHCAEEISKEQFAYGASACRQGEGAYKGCCTPTPRPINIARPSR
jgi:hypothetical protein